MGLGKSTNLSKILYWLVHMAGVQQKEPDCYAHKVTVRCHDLLPGSLRVATWRNFANQYEWNGHILRNDYAPYYK